MQIKQVHIQIFIEITQYNVLTCISVPEMMIRSKNSFCSNSTAYIQSDLVHSGYTCDQCKGLTTEPQRHQQSMHKC